MNDTKSRLKKILSDIKNVLGTEELEDLEIALEKINEDLHDNSSDDEFSLVRDCEGKIGEAERFFDDIARQEQVDNEIEERTYASYQSQR